MTGFRTRGSTLLGLLTVAAVIPLAGTSCPLLPQALTGVDVTVTPTTGTGDTTVQLSADPQGGVSPFTYAWSVSPTATITNADQQNASAALTAPATGSTTYTFTVTVTDAAGQTATGTGTATISASAVQALAVDAGSDTTVQEGSVVSLTATASGGTSPYSYQWVQTSGPAQTYAPASGAAQTISVTGTTAGTAVFQVTVTDAGGSTATDTVTVTVTEAPQPPGSLAFTLDLDNLTGTADADTFTATLLNDGGLQESLQTGDQANGLEGADVLNADLNGGNPAPTLASIETINVRALANSGLNAANITDTTAINLVNSGAFNLEITNVGSVVNMGITNSDGKYDLTYANEDATSGSSDAATLTLNDANGTVVIATPAGVTNGLETLNIVTTGNESTLDELTLTNMTSLATVNVTGDQALAITTALNASIKTVNASGKTAGGVDVTAGNVDFTFTGGPGDDRVAFRDGGFNNNDSVAGGDGTDTLGLASADAVAVTDELTNVTGIESLAIVNALAGNLDLTNFGTISTLTLEAGVNGDSTITVAAGSTVRTEADSSGAGGDDDVTIVVSTNGAGTSGETVTVQLADSTDANGTITGDLVLTGFESAAIQTSGGVAQSIGGALTITSDVPGAGASTTITITGDDNLTISGTTTATTVNASAFTGDLTITAAATTVSGGSGDDTITGSAAQNTINGNAGDDTINAGADADTVNGGEGDDAITGGAGNDALTGGAGQDTFVYATGTDGRDTITDFTAGEDGDIYNTNFVTTTAFGADTNEDVTPSANAVTLHTSTDAVFEVIGTLRATITDFTSGAQVLAAISNTSVSVAADGNRCLLVIYSGGNAYLYEVIEGGDVGAQVAANDITLVAVMQGVASGALVEENIQ